jgi:hypothetical protein
VAGSTRKMRIKIVNVKKTSAMSIKNVAKICNATTSTPRVTKYSVSWLVLVWRDVIGFVSKVATNLEDRLAAFKLKKCNIRRVNVIDKIVLIKKSPAVDSAIIEINFEKSQSLPPAKSNNRRTRSLIWLSSPFSARVASIPIKAIAIRSRNPKSVLQRIIK